MNRFRRYFAFLAVALMLWYIWDVLEVTYNTFQNPYDGTHEQVVDEMVYASIPLLLCLTTFVFVVRLALGLPVGVIGLSMLAVIAVPIIARLPLIGYRLLDDPRRGILETLLGITLLYLAWYPVSTKDVQIAK